jgi:hypothetical protein
MSEPELQQLVNKDSNGIVATIGADKITLTDGAESVSFDY